MLEPVPFGSQLTMGTPQLSRVLEHLADKDKTEFIEDTSPLFIAAREGHLDVVQCLVEHVNKDSTAHSCRREKLRDYFMSGELGSVSYCKDLSKY